MTANERKGAKCLTERDVPCLSHPLAIFSSSLEVQWRSCCFLPGGGTISRSPPFLLKILPPSHLSPGIVPRDTCCAHQTLVPASHPCALQTAGWVQTPLSVALFYLKEKGRNGTEKCFKLLMCLMGKVLIPWDVWLLRWVILGGGVAVNGWF